MLWVTFIYCPIAHWVWGGGWMGRMGALAWMFAEWLIDKKPTVLGYRSGVVAGLVAITPAAGFVNMPAALIIGLVAGMLGFYCIAKLKKKLGGERAFEIQQT